MKTIISMANNARNENLNKKRNETIIAIANHLYHALGSDILCRRATHSNPFIAVVRQVNWFGLFHNSWIVFIWHRLWMKFPALK